MRERVVPLSLSEMYFSHYSSLTILMVSIVLFTIQPPAADLSVEGSMKSAAMCDMQLDL